MKCPWLGGWCDIYDFTDLITCKCKCKCKTLTKGENVIVGFVVAGEISYSHKGTINSSIHKPVVFRVCTCFSVEPVIPEPEEHRLCKEIIQ